MTYPTPRRVVLTLADVRGLTVLERARACATVGVRETEIGPLLRAVTSHNGSPEDLERAVELLYAIAYQLGRREEPGLGWDDAQRWDLALDLDGPTDPIAEAEARASVEAAIATGLPPKVAGDLTLAEIEAYGDVRAEAAGRRRRPDPVRDRPETVPDAVTIPAVEMPHETHGAPPGEMLEELSAMAGSRSVREPRSRRHRVHR